MLLTFFLLCIGFLCCVLKVKAHDLCDQTHGHVDFLLCFLL